MAEFILPCGRKMLCDDADAGLFESRRLYSIRSRNEHYAYFGKNGIAHRLILGLKDKSVVVDHINGNGLDNRRANLRAVSSAENVKNRRVSRSKTGLPPGLFKFRNGYMVQVTDNYKKIFVGTFSDIEEARAALNAKRTELGRPHV